MQLIQLLDTIGTLQDFKSCIGRSVCHYHDSTTQHDLGGTNQHMIGNGTIPDGTPARRLPWNHLVGRSLWGTNESNTFCVADTRFLPSGPQWGLLRHHIPTEIHASPVVEIFKVWVPGWNFNMARYTVIHHPPSSDSMFTERIRRIWVPPTVKVCRV